MFRPDLLDILSDAVTAAAPGALRLGFRAVGCEPVGERVVLRFELSRFATCHEFSDGLLSCFCQIKAQRNPGRVLASYNARSFVGTRKHSNIRS
jgi:hypothetical protein